MVWSVSVHLTMQPGLCEWVTNLLLLCCNIQSWTDVTHQGYVQSHTPHTPGQENQGGDTYDKGDTSLVYRSTWPVSFVVLDKEHYKCIFIEFVQLFIYVELCWTFLSAHTDESTWVLVLWSSGLILKPVRAKLKLRIDGLWLLDR